MKRSLLALTVVAMAAMAAPGHAESSIGAATFSSTGPAVQVNSEPGSESYQVPLAGSLVGAFNDDDLGLAKQDVTCTLTANGIAASSPIPGDDPIWNFECSNGDASLTASALLIGGNRPLQRGPVVTGLNVVEIGGVIVFNGEVHEPDSPDHVMTCRGTLQNGTVAINLACIIL